MHTVEKAQTLWCPMVRLTAPTDTDARASINRYASCGMGHSPGFNCIGPKCAMWRWACAVTEHQGEFSRAHYGGPAEGYCGLAGRPGV